VLIVEETEDRDKLTAGQREAMLSNADGSVRGYLSTHKYPLRLLDKDDSLDRDEPKFRAAFALPRPAVPWLYVIRDHGQTVSIALPKDAAATLALLKKYGGP
jgi:hypothetical protein